MSKILITSGCSFSECISPHMETWPKHLYRSLKPYGFDKHISSAMGSQGNGLISRGIIYNVIKALETYDSQDILVGVMWSHCSRMDYRCEFPNSLSWGSTNTDGWIENPTSFVKDGYKHWVIMNAGWQNEEAKAYYKYFYDGIGASIYSLEHILRTQLFLQSKKIKYFFTDFVDNNIVDETSQYLQENICELEYLIKQIDRSYYLPVTSEHRWVLENSITKKEFEEGHWYNGHRGQWIHPKSEQHKEFTDRVIRPYLLEKKYIHHA